MDTDDTSTWICPLHPFGHPWDGTSLACRLCGHVRTPGEAITSLLSGLPGWDDARAGRLVAAHTTAVTADPTHTTTTPEEGTTR